MNTLAVLASFALGVTNVVWATDSRGYMLAGHVLAALLCTAAALAWLALGMTAGLERAICGEIDRT